MFLWLDLLSARWCNIIAVFFSNLKGCGPNMLEMSLAGDFLNKISISFNHQFRLSFTSFFSSFNFEFDYLKSWHTFSKQKCHCLSTKLNSDAIILSLFLNIYFWISLFTTIFFHGSFQYSLWNYFHPELTGIFAYLPANASSKIVRKYTYCWKQLI